MPTDGGLDAANFSTRSLRLSLETSPHLDVSMQDNDRNCHGNGNEMFEGDPSGRTTNTLYDEMRIILEETNSPFSVHLTASIAFTLVLDLIGKGNYQTQYKREGSWCCRRHHNRMGCSHLK
jgi:hypothetical protein